MFINHNEKKLIHALIYFLNHTSWSGKKKLYKLLFVLDFEHYALTGRSVTGLDYFAWKMGPVPTALHEAIDSEDDLIQNAFRIEIKRKKQYTTVFLHPKIDFDERYFSKRQLRLLKDIVQRFDMASGEDMVWFTHQEMMPWHKVWEVEGRKQEKIPYEYALDSLDNETHALILDFTQERQAFLTHFQ